MTASPVKNPARAEYQPAEHQPAVLLALDTSTHTVGVAVYDGVRVLSELTWKTHDYHTVELAPAVVEVLQRAGLSVASVKALGVALGPGSFTGLRIGLALAKGLALARHIPLLGIPTLDVLVAAQAPGASPEMPLAAVLHAGRGRLAVGWYHYCILEPEGESSVGRWMPTKPVEVITAQELNNQIQKPTRVCGELDEEERRLLARKRRNVSLASPASSLRRPAFLAELAWERWQAGEADDPAALAPIYLHFNDPIPG